MNTSAHRLCRIAPILLAIALVTSCSTAPNDRVSGGEDFPNTLEALGRALAEGLDSTSAWNGLADAASYPSTQAIPDSSSLVASRQAGILCAPAIDSGLIGDSLAYQSKTTCPDGSTVRDSLVVRMADSLIRLVQRDSAGPLGLVRKSETYVADSADGFRLTGFAGRILVRTLGQRGRWKSIIELVLDAGADLSWTTESDNNIWRGGQAVVRDETDTLDRWTVRPFPLRNAPIYRREEGDSGLAILNRRQVLSSGAVREESGVMMIFRHDTLNYPVRSHIHVSSGTDNTIEESIVGTRTDSTFRPGDSAIFLRRARHGQDTLREEIRLLASESPRDHSGDRITYLASSRYRSAGLERYVGLKAIPASPLSAGSPFTDGHVVLEVGRSNGETIRFEGTMTNGVTSGRWVSSSDSGSVRLDSRGKVLESTP